MRSSVGNVSPFYPPRSPSPTPRSLNRQHVKYPPIFRKFDDRQAQHHDRSIANMSSTPPFFGSLTIAKPNTTIASHPNKNATPITQECREADVFRTLPNILSRKPKSTNPTPKPTLSPVGVMRSYRDRIFIHGRNLFFLPPGPQTDRATQNQPNPFKRNEK
jgi:hypothetical protein